MVSKAVLISFHSVLNSGFLDYSPASLLNVPGICTVDKPSLLLITKSQIDSIVILLELSDLQLLTQSNLIRESQIWSRKDLSSKKIILVQVILVQVEVLLKIGPQFVADASVAVIVSNLFYIIKSIFDLFFSGNIRFKKFVSWFTISSIVVIQKHLFRTAKGKEDPKTSKRLAYLIAKGSN